MTEQYEKTPEEEWVEKNAPKVLGVNEKDLITTQLITIVDKYDEVIVKDILGVFNHKNTKEILNTRRSGSFAKAHGHIINMCFALVSVNVHCRNYFNKLESAREHASKEMLSWDSKYETAIYNQEITVEIIGALMSFKTALDCLSQALAAMYGYSLKTWGDNGNKVLKALNNNLTEKDKPSAERLISFIERHRADTKDYINLRDNLGHGLTDYKDTLSGFFKRKDDIKPQNPRVQINDKVIDTYDLMEACRRFSGQYCREVVALSLSNIVPGITVGILDGRYIWSHNFFASTDLKTGKTEFL